MKNYLGFILLLVATRAMAGFPPTTLKGQEEATAPTTFNYQTPNFQATTTAGTTRLIETGNYQLLQNPSFEGITASTSWTANFGTLAGTTSFVHQGKVGIKWDLAAQSGNVLQNQTPNFSLQNVTLEASCWVNTTLTSINVCALENGSQNSCTSFVPGDGAWHLAKATTTITPGNSAGVQIVANSVETGSVYIDDCYLGQARADFFKGTANTPAGFNASGDIFSVPGWSIDSTHGTYTYAPNVLSGVTVPSGSIFSVNGTYNSGSVFSGSTGYQYAPTFSPGSVADNILGYVMSPAVNTSFQNFTGYDAGPAWQANASGNNVIGVNVHDFFNTGATVANGMIGVQVGAYIDSGSNVNGFSAFRDTTNFINGATVGSNIISYGAYPQVGVTSSSVQALDNGTNILAGSFVNSTTGLNSHIGFQSGASGQYNTGVALNNQYQSGSSPGYHTGIQHNPYIQAPLSGFTIFDDGTSFASGGSVSNPLGLNLHPLWQSGSTMDGQLSMLNITPQWDPGSILTGSRNAQMININPQSATPLDVITAINISMQGVTASNTMTAIDISLSGVTTSSGSPATGFNQNGGLFSSNYEAKISSTGFFQANYLGGQATIPAGQPVSNTFGFGDNLASGLFAEDNMGDDGTGLKLGFTSVGFVGSAAVLSGATVDTINGALAGFGIPAQSTGGTIENVALYYGAGLLPQGGTLNVTNMKGFRLAGSFCSGASGSCRGLSVEDPSASNYLASTVTLDGLTANTATYLDADKTVRSSVVTSSELAFLSGATANIQAQINSFSMSGITAYVLKSGDTMSGSLAGVQTLSAATVNISGVTANRVVVSNAANQLIAGPVTSSELSYLSGVTTSLAPIATALNGVTGSVLASYLNGLTANVQSQLNTIANPLADSVSFAGNGSGTSACTTSPCTIVSQYSQTANNWVSSVTRSSAGMYTVNFVASHFSSAPICVCAGNGLSGAPEACTVGNGGIASTSSVVVSTFKITTLSNADSGLFVHCSGPH